MLYVASGMADWPYLEGSWFKIPVLVGRCGQLPVVLGFAPARDLFAVSFADLFEESAQTGYQRPCDLRHAREFREYIEGPGATTIPLTFNLRGRSGPTWRLEPECQYVPDIAAHPRLLTPRPGRDMVLPAMVPKSPPGNVRP